MLQSYDVTGRLVETLLDEWRPAGEYEVAWQPNALASGVCLYRLQTDGAATTRRMVLMRWCQMKGREPF